MKKLFVLSIFAFFLYCDQPTDGKNNDNLKVSKDSLKVHNYPSDSLMDQIIIKNTSEDSIFLDSAYLLFDVFDTSGLSRKIEAHWMEDMYGDFMWNLSEIGINKYKLEKQFFSPNDTAIPLRFFPYDSCVLLDLRIGMNLAGSYIPKYPKYLKGSLQLYFSNKQIINIRLYSDDLRAE